MNRLAGKTAPCPVRVENHSYTPPCTPAEVYNVRVVAKVMPEEVGSVTMPGRNAQCHPPRLELGISSR